MTWLPYLIHTVGGIVILAGALGSVAYRALKRRLLWRVLQRRVLRS